MKILVPIKKVVDYNVQVRPTSDNKRVDTENVKMGINYKNNYPVVAILDPIIPSNAPIRVLASSGCDALVHALEAYMSTKSNRQSADLSPKHVRQLILSLRQITWLSYTLTLQV